MPAQEKPGRPLGDAADEDWTRRALAAYNSLPHGAKQRVAERLGVHPSHLSKMIRRGSGRAEFIMSASRELRVAPPRRLVDEQQWALLDLFEQFRRDVAALHGEAALQPEVSGLLRRIAMVSSQLLLHGDPSVIATDDEKDG